MNTSSVNVKPVSEMTCDSCGRGFEDTQGQTFTASTDGRVWHYGCSPNTRPEASSPVSDDGELVKQLLGEKLMIEKIEFETRQYQYWETDIGKKAADRILSLREENERLRVEAETYRQMHETAREMGYLSILEALEAAPERPAQ